MSIEAARYKAIVVASDGGEKKDTGTLQLGLEFEVHQKMVQGEWCTCESGRITGYLNLIKKDGSDNESNLKRLVKVFGWDGTLRFLRDKLTGKECQITTQWREYDGKKRIEVQWVNHVDDEGGGVTPNDDATQAALAAEFDSRFKAAIGGIAVSAPMPKRPAPAVPAKSASAKMPGKPQPSASTQEVCWAAYLAQAGDAVSEDDLNRGWWALVSKVCPGKDAEKMDKMDWGRVLAEIPTLGPTHFVKADDIPF
jgi:hypothetical protein